MDPSFLFFIAFAVALLLFAYMVSLNLWITAIFSGVKITLLEMLFMKIRRAPVQDIINSLIVTHKAGYPVPLVELEVHGLADGDVMEAAKAYIKCRIDDIDISFQEVATEERKDKSWDQIVKIQRERLNTDELRKSISRRVLQDLSDDQIKKVETYISKLE